jgi:hypothetical protein
MSSRGKLSLGARVALLAAVTTLGVASAAEAARVGLFTGTLSAQESYASDGAYPNVADVWVEADHTVCAGVSQSSAGYFWGPPTHAVCAFGTAHYGAASGYWHPAAFDPNGVTADNVATSWFDY